MDKIVSARDAALLVSPGDTVTTSGFVGAGVPDCLLAALETRFLDTGTPRDLTLFFAAGQGDGKNRGLNRLGHEGLLKRVVGGHWGLIPKVGKLALEGKIEAYNLPQGVISHLYRDIAAGKPGTVTHVGLGTFVDPALEGGKINSITTEDLVEHVTLGGRDLLFYKAMPVNVALLRGTTADANGNVTLEREALVLDNLAQAMAARNSGGVVIVQVERLAAKGALNPRQVILPAALVDAVVVSEPEFHMQTYATQYSHLFAGQFRAPETQAESTPLDVRKIIARRAAFELPVNGVVNLGIGMPEGVADVAAEEGLLEHVTLTAEPGVVGGQPASGLNFGAAVNTDAVIPQNAQFDFYDGGGLDLAVLGMAEADATGNVNVSRFGSRLAGAGGFINISQNAGTVVFGGTFTAGGADIGVENGKLVIRTEGRARKFRSTVEQVTFSGRVAAQAGKHVLYVTERCVFELRPDGLHLIEIAPGLDLDRDILGQMDFAPKIGDLAEMDLRIFAQESMGLKVDLLHLDLDDRIALDPKSGRLFINFGSFRIRGQHDLDMIRERVETVCADARLPVDVIVNYDKTQIDEDIAEDYAEMVRALEERFYGRVARYSSMAFMRMWLGETFTKPQADLVFESDEEALKYLGS